MPRARNPARPNPKRRRKSPNRLKNEAAPNQGAATRREPLAEPVPPINEVWQKRFGYRPKVWAASSSAENAPGKRWP